MAFPDDVHAPEESKSSSAAGVPAGAPKGLFNKEAPWKDRTKRIVIKMTPDEKARAQKILDESPFDDWREAFFAWLLQQKGTSFLTETEAKFLDARRTTTAITKKLGHRKLQFLMLKYKSLGGKSDGRNIEEVFVEMVSKLLDKRSGQKGITLEDLIVFKQFAASWKATKDLERAVLSSAADAVKNGKKKQAQLAAAPTTPEPAEPVAPEDKLVADLLRGVQEWASTGDQGKGQQMSAQAMVAVSEHIGKLGGPDAADGAIFIGKVRTALDKEISIPPGILKTLKEWP